jgi:cystathionine beta-lyase/cystathionine gamma-synthase
MDSKNADLRARTEQFPLGAHSGMSEGTICARGPSRTESTSHPLAPSIDVSTVYCLADLDHVDAVYDGSASGFIYARDAHPNAAQLAEKMARLEGGEAGLICASGMGAIASVLLSLLGQHDHILVSQGVYGRTSSLVSRQLVRWGIGHDVFDPADAGGMGSLLKGRTRLIFVETLSNPLLRVADLDSLAAVAREARIPLVVDNTFAPLLCRPIDRGASLVVHSVTKMIGGHSDLTLGVVLGSRPMVEQIQNLASTLGQTGNPFESWLALRGLATLSLRMRRCCATALELARRFEAHGQLARVIYPGLPSHRDHALASRILDGGFGAMMSIDLGDRARAGSFMRALPSIPFAPSLGDVQTTLSNPATTSHRGQDSAQLARQGITAGLIRLSVGLEDPGDLWREFEQALDAANPPGQARLS